VIVIVFPGYVVAPRGGSFAEKRSRANSIKDEGIQRGA
jgi:hypothetical protein